MKIRMGYSPQKSKADSYFGVEIRYFFDVGISTCFVIDVGKIQNIGFPFGGQALRPYGVGCPQSPRSRGHF
jgi:hypothetical protein